MKIVTIIGARPQFIKAAPVSRALRKAGYNEFILHTGQHYDYEMSEAFFKELEIPEPDVNLRVGSGTHGWQTGQMLMHIEKVLLTENPSYVLVYGDTNSTLAGALTAVKLHIPVAHVEAGLRSFNREMPEEHNRVLTDHCSDILFCPTQTAMKNLKHEGVTKGVHLVGDVMYDSFLYNIRVAEKTSNILEKLDLKPKSYALTTVHRAENTDEQKRLKSIFDALSKISQDGLTVVVPLHPRTRKKVYRSGGFQLDNLILIDPVSYLDMLLLEKESQIILTDSGGVQKEAYWFKVACVTLRDETEWIELVEHSCNTLVGCDKEKIYHAYSKMVHKDFDSDINLFGNGNASKKIAEIIAMEKPKS